MLPLHAAIEQDCKVAKSSTASVTAVKGILRLVRNAWNKCMLGKATGSFGLPNKPLEVDLAQTLHQQLPTFQTAVSSTTTMDADQFQIA